MRMEQLDSRALGALRFLDGETALPLTQPLALSGSGVRVVRSARGLYALTEASGFEAYTARFEAPPQPEPAPLSFPLAVIDPSGRHLPRSFSIELPRDASATPADPSRSVFTPVDVRMFLSSTARPTPGSAAVRLSLTDEEDAPLAQVVIRLRVTIPEKPAIEAQGLSDSRGEVLLLVPRIPIIQWGQEEGGALIHTSFQATLESAFAPSVAGLPAPDVTDASFTLLPDTLQVASGLEIHRRIQISTP